VKNALLIWNALLTIVLGIVAYRQFEQPAVEVVNPTAGEVSQQQTFEGAPIYYVNTDSLSQNYLFAKDLDEQLKRKKQQYDNRFQEKVKKFEKEVVSFQENARWMSKEEGERKQQELMVKEQELAQLEQELTKNLFEDQEKLNADLRKRILDHIKLVKEKQTYAYVLGYSSIENNILLANDSLDITQEVLSGLNAVYQAESKEQK
jgi:outer membrane protein